MKKRILATLLAIIVMVSVLPTAFAAPLTGTCGENLTWVADPDTKTLTISGTGPMMDYAYQDYQWERILHGYYRSTEEGKTYVPGICDTVIIEEGATSIGDYAFASCSALTSITVPNSVTEIGNHAFSSCANLKSFTIPDSVTTIEEDAFYNCTSLNNVTIPDSVTYIGSRAFCDCDSLTSVTIPGSITELLDVFEFCNSLSTVTILPGVTTIGNYAFYCCRGLTDVTIPDSVTSIGSYAFAYCSDLVKLTIPGNIASVGDHVFVDSTSLTKLVFSEGTSELALDLGLFHSCTSLEDIENCPDEALNARLVANRAVLTGLLSPEQYISSQSTKITSLANEITAGLTSDYERAKAIDIWVANNIEYDYDAYYNQNYTTIPEEVLDSRLTDCIGYALLTQALLQAANIPAVYVFGSADGISGWSSHAWNLAFVDGRWIWMDTTWESTGGGYYFDTGTAYISFEHKASKVSGPILNEPGSPTPSMPFTDVLVNEYYADAIAWAVEQGITNGTSATTFSPDVSCTRAQIVTLLWRAAGSPSANGNNPFTDVPQGSYYYDAVLWATSQGITTGTSATTFSPDTVCTRAQVVTFLYRAAGSPATAGTSPFTDVVSGSYYTDAIQWAVSKGVVNGTTPTTFSPEQTCSRAQIVTLLYRDRADKT